MGCLGFVVVGSVPSRAESTANEGDDHGHHEEGYFVGPAFVRHGEGQAVAEAVVCGGEQPYAQIACVVLHIRSLETNAEDLDVAMVSGFEYRAEIDLEGCQR